MPARPATRDWYGPLLSLYGVAMILSNPFVASGLFYVTLAFWIVLAYLALKHGPRGARKGEQALLIAVLLWAFAVLPAFLFLVTVAAAMWYVGELASIVLATWVLSACAAPLAENQRTASLLRRTGFVAGVATGVLMLFPIATYFIPAFEVTAIFNPILFYLPFIVMFATAAMATASFALVRVYAYRA